VTSTLSSYQVGYTSTARRRRNRVINT
jgi:hypothetical protein